MSCEVGVMACVELVGVSGDVMGRDPTKELSTHTRRRGEGARPSGRGDPLGDALGEGVDSLQ